MLPETLSPKAVIAFVIPIVAAVVLFLVFGDATYLLLILLGLATGGGAIVAPPATGVTQNEVETLARQKQPQMLP